MKSEILYPGAFPMVRVDLAAGESIKAESGAMVASSPTIDIESKMEGGFLGALSRKFLTGEKFFFQTLRATRGAGEVLLAPTVPGEGGTMTSAPVWRATAAASASALKGMPWQKTTLPTGRCPFTRFR